jgi:hypothetical protein
MAMPAPAEIEHARRLGNAEVIGRPPPPDREKVDRSLAESDWDLGGPEIPWWDGSRYRPPVSPDRRAAILAVADYEKILLDLTVEPDSRYRGQAAAVAAFLRIEAAIPVLLSILDAPIPETAAVSAKPPGEMGPRLKALEGHLAAVATWKVAVTGLASLDRPELIDRLTLILFDPPPGGFRREPAPRGDLADLA